MIFQNVLLLLIFLRIKGVKIWLFSGFEKFFVKVPLGFAVFLHVGTLIKLFKPFKLQTVFMEVPYIETFRSSIKRKSRYIHQLLRNQGGFKWSFFVGYMICLRNISFFSNWLRPVQYQCNIVIYKTTDKMEYLNPYALEAHSVCYFYRA